MNTIIYTHFDQKIHDEWLALWKKSSEANFTNAPQWFVSALDTFNYKEYKIVAMYNNDSLVGIAALVKEKIYGMQIYALISSDFVCGMPFLIDSSDKRALHVFANELLALGTIYLKNVPEFFKESLETVCKVQSVQSTVNYMLEIIKDEKGEAIIQNRKKLLQRSKVIADKLTMRSFTGLDEKALNIAFAIDRKSSKNVYGYNAFSDKQTIAFYRNLSKKFQEYLSLHVLFYDNKPIAYQLGFLINKTFFCSQKAYVKEYRAYSIGRVLLIKMIDYFNEIQVDTINFGSGEDEMKRSLTKLQRPLYSLILSQNSFAGKYIIYLGRVRNFAFSHVHKYKKIYAIYRKCRNIISARNK